MVTNTPRVEQRPSIEERVQGAKVVRVEATITFTAYADTRLPRTGVSVEDRVAEQISDAIGVHGGRGLDTEQGDVLIAPLGDPGFAIDVRQVAVTELRDVPAPLDDVVDAARGVTASW